MLAVLDCAAELERENGYLREALTRLAQAFPEHDAIQSMAVQLEIFPRPNLEALRVEQFHFRRAASDNTRRKLKQARKRAQGAITI